MKCSYILDNFPFKIIPNIIAFKLVNAQNFRYITRPFLELKYFGFSL